MFKLSLKKNSHNYALAFEKNDVDVTLQKCKERIHSDRSHAIPAVYNESMTELDNAGLKILEKNSNIRKYKKN